MSDSNKYIYGKSGPSVFISPRGDDKNPGTFELPLNALKKAVEICRTENIKDIVAFEGEYEFCEPIELNENDSGLKISSYNNEKVIFSGSKNLSCLKWHEFPQNPSIKAAQIDKGLWIDRLFINGKEQIIARYILLILILCACFLRALFIFHTF